MPALTPFSFTSSRRDEARRLEVGGALGGRPHPPT
eukprot:CAMPEP_0173260724 /NCGR_PEP_ID=MMETSP1142-20121109/25750_1 /TAXON_ID=483371 /ORGANISM="non described non described, Strain CCMP2298" /LENGTH=34 /DNA_ID= /DNA_START= /DNA_END= /DNA_ORIENTATION=